MRAAGIVLLAVAAVLPARPALARALVGALGGGFLVRAVWTTGFDQGGGRLVYGLVLVALAGLAAWLIPQAPSQPSGWRPIATLMAGAAVYACLPETDQFREVMVVLVAAVLVEIAGLVVLPPAAATASWALVAWAAVYGATGRISALVGGLFALLVPIVASAAAVRRANGWVGTAVAAVWSLTALVVARTGGVSASGRDALVAAAVGLAVAAGVSALVWRWNPPAPLDE